MYTPNGKYAAWAEEYRPTDRFTVAAHGDEREATRGYPIDNRPGPKHRELVEPERLKTMIDALAPSGCKPIWLLVCFAGDGGDNSYAAKLSALYPNSTVYSPTGFFQPIWGKPEFRGARKYHKFQKGKDLGEKG